MSDPTDWIELKGKDLLLKILDTNTPSSSPVEGQSAPIEAGDSVLVDFTVRQSDHPGHLDGNVCQTASSWLVTVGVQVNNKEINEALDVALLRLQNHQTAYIWSTSNYAFGEGPRKSNTNNDYTLPANSSVLYHITQAMKVKDTSRLNPYFTLQKANTRKLMANDYYVHEWPLRRERAARLYEQTGTAMETLVNGTYFRQVAEGTNHPQYQQAKQLWIDSYNNILALRMRSKQYSLAEPAGAKVLKIDPNNLKALVRLAKTALADNKNEQQKTKADRAIKNLEQAVTYKNPQEEAEARKLRVQWKKKFSAS